MPKFTSEYDDTLSAATMDQIRSIVQEEGAKLMAKVDDVLAAVKAGSDGVKASVDAAVAKLGTLGDLTPEQQAVADGVVADLNAAKTNLDVAVNPPAPANPQ